MISRITVSALFLLPLLFTIPTVEARDNIVIVGSSTVYPFSKAVTTIFSEKTGLPLPQLTPTGSGGGLKKFCQGSGPEHPDVTNASRPIKRSEYDQCKANGVDEIIEVKIGYDGIVLASSTSAPPMNLSIKELYLAIAAQVPDMDSDKLIPNPYKSWKQINPALPDTTIEVLGPPKTSGTRDAFSELALDKGCSQYAWIKAIKKHDKQNFRKICRTVRNDGHFIEAGERDDLIVENLLKSESSSGIFGYNFLVQNPDKLQAATIQSISPTSQTIATGEYPLSRALYFYVKKNRIPEVPGLLEYMKTFTDETMWGPDGQLVKLGLIPLSKEERKAQRQIVEELKPLNLD